MTSQQILIKAFNSSVSDEERQQVIKLTEEAHYTDLAIGMKTVASKRYQNRFQNTMVKIELKESLETRGN